MDRYIFELTVGIPVFLARGWIANWLSKHFFVPIGRVLYRRFVVPFQMWFKRRFIITKRDAAIILHYWNKSHNKGHQHKNPIICNDENCRFI